MLFDCFTCCSAIRGSSVDPCGPGFESSRVVDEGRVELCFQKLEVRGVEMEIYRAITGPFPGKETKSGASENIEREKGL